MSRTIYTYRDDHRQPVGSHGPLDELSSIYTPWQRTLDPTPEQEIDAGWFNGPNLSNRNAAMVLRSLDLDPEQYTFDAADMLGRVTLALHVGGTTADDGQPDIQVGNMIDCGVPAGYFARVYEAMLPVCEQAVAWNADIVVA